MKALITGHAGFSGRYLTAHLRAVGHEVIGFDRDRGDVRDRAAIRAAVAAWRPDVVFHLAAALKAAPEELYGVNVLGTVALLDAIVELELRPTVIVTSSSAVYGATPAGTPVSEDVPPRPRTHYGASKLAQEVAALRYHDAHGIPVVRARAFNLLGPGLPELLACGAFADRVARAERSGEPIATGNLASARDFTDIRDVVRAYAALADHGVPGEVYNVCAGRSVTLRACLDTLVQHAGRPIEMHTDPSLIQTNDVDIQIGDATRIATLTGWRPEISIETSLADMLADSRRRNAGGHDVTPEGSSR